MYYPDEIVEEVRSRSDIVDVVGSYVKLQRKGRDYFGLCPFHNEKTPSFSVSSTKQIYYCFGCGAGGNVVSFIMQYENESFTEALKLLAERSGVALPEVELSQEEKEKHSKRQQLLEIHKVAAGYFYYILGTAQGKIARDYLDGRALNKEIRQKFGLGYTGKYNDGLYKYLKSKNYSDELIGQSGLVIFDEKRGAHDRFWNRVMYPIMDINSKVIGFGGRVMGDGMPKYLNSPESSIFDKSRNLYGLNYARSTRKNYMIICEGYMDVIAMHQAGFTNAVASLGTAFTSQHGVLIKRYTEEVRLAYDSDGAGIKAALRAIPILKSAGLEVRIINMEPYKDPDEFIKNLGAEAFEKRIEDAMSSFMFEIAVMEKGYKQSDPAARSAFLNAVAKRLLEFPLELEREVYIDAICSKYGIETDKLRKAVNSFGATMTREQVDLARNASYNEQAKPDIKVVMRKDRKAPKEDGISSAQSLLIGWLIDEPEIFEKLEGIIDENDFVEGLYFRVAKRIFEDHRASLSLTPAKLINEFEEADEQKQVTAMFASSSLISDDKLVREKTLNEIVRRIKKNSLDTAIRGLNDPRELQNIIIERKKLEKLKIKL